MQSDRTASANGHPVSPANGSGSRAKLESLQAKCRHQAVVIDTLSEAVSTFHRGAKALKAENSELRAENVRLRDSRRSSARRGRPSGRWRAGRGGDRSGRSGAWRGSRRRGGVPGAAGRGVCCGEREAAGVRAGHQQLATQRRSEDEMLVSVELMPDCFRVGVQDSGSDAVIAARPADLDTGGGFGLNLVADAQRALGRRAARRRRHSGLGAAPAGPRRCCGGPNGNGSGRLATRAA